MTTQNDTKIKSFLSFRVGTELFAANVSNVLSILEMTKITRVPKSPDYLKGVINLRGNVLPVLDTRLKFGMTETEYTTNTCILVLNIKLNKEAIQLGAIVDNVSEVLELTDDDISPPPTLGTAYKTNYLSGMAKQNDNFIMIIDPNIVFADDEIINISEIKTEDLE